MNEWVIDCDIDTLSAEEVRVRVRVRVRLVLRLTVISTLFLLKKSDRE